MKTPHQSILLTSIILPLTSAKLADRSRLHNIRKSRQANNKQQYNGDDNVPPLPIEGPNYRIERQQEFKSQGRRLNSAPGSIRGSSSSSVTNSNDVTPRANMNEEPVDPFHRHLSSQLTGCCTNYISSSASDMCTLYNQDCTSGDQPSHDSGDQDCTQAGLSFIGISFSVNTAAGNPYSYQLCDQFPMENIIDRDYEYVMGMDEDGWLVGGGYKSFDYSGKMP
jgi:hypothetical protein